MQQQYYQFNCQIRLQKAICVFTQQLYKTNSFKHLHGWLIGKESGYLKWNIQKRIGMVSNQGQNRKTDHLITEGHSKVSL